LEKLKKYTPLLVHVFSSVIIVLMIVYMIFSINSVFMKTLMILQFFCDFYFVTKMFYRMQTYSRVEKYIILAKTLLPFFLSIFNLFYITGFFSIDRFYLRETFWAYFFTRFYHLMFLVYLFKIIDLFQVIISYGKKTINNLIISKFNLLFSIVIGIMFILFYHMFSSLFASNFMKTYDSFSDEFLTEANYMFSNIYADNIDSLDYEAFAKEYNGVLFYYDNDLKYRADDFDAFNAKHMLFETSIIEGYGIFFVVSGKIFTTTYYIFVMLYVITLLLFLLIMTLLLKYIIYNNMSSYISIIIKGLSDDSYMLAINTDSMKETDIKCLAILYNKKILAYKYKDKYIKSLN